MRELAELGLVKYRFPMAAHDSGFAEGFLTILDRAIVPRLGDPGVWETVPVHLEKVGRTLRDELIARRLAQIDPRSHWLRLEPATAKLLMSYLACEMASDLNARIVAITNDQENLDVFSPSGLPTAVQRDAAPARDLILAALLPSASARLGPRELLRFKERHGGKLARFRGEVERAVHEVAHVADHAERDRLLGLKRTELIDQQEEVVSLLREGRWLPAAAWSLVATGCSAVDSLPLFPWYSSAAAIIGAGVVGVRKGISRYRALRQPLAYGALARVAERQSAGARKTRRGVRARRPRG